MRILDKTVGAPPGHLGMPHGHSREVTRSIVRAPFGMVLCAGPTGSGKTTTLYATLSEINDPTRNIMTIEDPVEYVFPSINQIQTNEQAGLTFADGLKSILRQDPDVILVGEIRDVETARIAVQSAMTGHFVLSSLHATDTVAALHRFLDMGIESFLIASSVVAVVGQRLVRRICPACKATYRPKDEELAFYEEGGGGPQRTCSTRARMQLLRRHRLPGPHRRLRAAADDPGDQAPDRRLGDPGGAAAHGHSRACDPPGEAIGLVAEDVTRSPKSSDRSTRSEDEEPHAKVQVHRHDAGRSHGHRTWRTRSQSSMARRALLAKDLSPLDVREKKSILTFEITKKKVKRRDLMHFSRQMAVFMRAGIPVLESMEVIPTKSATKCSSVSWPRCPTRCAPARHSRGRLTSTRRRFRPTTSACCGRRS